MKEDDFCYRETLFFTSILIIYCVESVRANHFTTTPTYNMENQIVDSLRKQTSPSYSPHQSTTMKNQAINFKLGESVTDKGNNSRNEYLHSTRKNTFMGYGLFVKNDYLKNSFINNSTPGVISFKPSHSAQNSRNNSFNTNYSTHKTSIESNHNFHRNKESQIEKYQAINNDHHADRIKYLIMGDQNIMKVSKANLSQNPIDISSLVPKNNSSVSTKEHDVNSLQIPLDSPNKLTNTMIVDQHTRIMLQMNHDVNDELLKNYEKKENVMNNSTKQAVNNSIGNTRAGQKNLIMNISNNFGDNKSYGQDHIGRPQSNSQEIHKMHTYSKFEPYSNSHITSNAMYECKSCRIDSQQIYSPSTNHMRDKDVVGNAMQPYSNKIKNSGQVLVPMNNIIRNSPQGYNPGGFKVNTTPDQRVVVNNFMNPNKYDTIGSNSMNVNKFEKNPNVMTPDKIKGMEPHRMQPNKHDMNSFEMQNSYNKQELTPVSHVSMKQNISINGNGYNYIPPNNYHIGLNTHNQNSLHNINNVNEEHMVKPYNYKIPMQKPHVDLHSQNNDEKEYMEHIINHHNHEVQSSMMSKPHTYSENQNSYDKENMMKPNYYFYDKPSSLKPHVEAALVQNNMEKGSFMEQMMMLMMMKFGEHMAPNNVINFNVGSDKHGNENIKMEPMMKFNRIHPMLPMHRTTSAMPDKKEDDKYVLVKMPAKHESAMHPGHDKKEEEKYVLVKMPSKPESTIIDHSYIPYSPFGWISGWYSGLIFPDRKRIFTVIFLIVVIILTKKLLLALVVIKFFLAIVPVLAFILLLKKYLLFLLVTKWLKFFKKFKKIPLLFAVKPLFFFPIIIPFFYLCKKGESSSTEYTITYPTFTHPEFTFPIFTFPPFTFPTKPETTGRTETMTMPPATHTLQTTTMAPPTTTMPTMVTTMTETMTMNTESMATQTMSMETHPMSMATQPMTMASPSMSMASPPMSMATQPMTMSGRIGVVNPTKRPSAKSTVAMNIVRNRIRVKYTKLPALLTQYKNDINSYKLSSPMKKTSPMFSASTGKKLTTPTYENMERPLRWHGVTMKPQPTKSMDKLVTNKQKPSTHNKNCGGDNKHCEGTKNNNQTTSGVRVNNQKKNSSIYLKLPQKIGSLQNKKKPYITKNMITNTDKQKLKNVLRDGAVVKTVVNLNKMKNKNKKSKQIANKHHSKDLSNGIEILRERFPRQSSSFISLFNRMWSALASDRCMERIGCHLAVNSKRVTNYNSLIIRLLQSLFSRRANRRVRSYMKAYQLGSKKEGSHFMCRYLFPCLGILKI